MLKQSTGMKLLDCRSPHPTATLGFQLLLQEAASGVPVLWETVTQEPCLARTSSKAGMELPGPSAACGTRAQALWAPRGCKLLNLQTTRGMGSNSTATLSPDLSRGADRWACKVTEVIQQCGEEAQKYKKLDSVIAQKKAADYKRMIRTMNCLQRSRLPPGLM